MNISLKKFLLVFGAGFLLFWLSRPSGKGRKPNTSEADQATQMKNAQTALDAYMAALQAGEQADALAELNRQIEQEFNLRVYFKRSDGHYYVADTNGKDILRS